MKIIAFDRTPDSPMIMPPRVELVADSSVTLTGKPMFLPDFTDNWEASVYLAVRVSRLGKSVSEKFAMRYFDAYTAAVRLRPAGVELTPGMAGLIDYTTALGTWIPATETGGSALDIECGGITTRIEHPGEMAAESVRAISEYATLKIGDVIMVCHSTATIPVTIGTDLSARISGHEVLEARIK